MKYRKTEFYCPRCKMYIDNPSPTSKDIFVEGGEITCSECGYHPIFKFKKASKKELKLQGMLLKK